jgi:hypothetical protein
MQKKAISFFRSPSSEETEAFLKSPRRKTPRDDSKKSFYVNQIE